MLPADWLDGAAIANALRSIGRQQGNLLLNYGAPQGFLPLRQQLQLKLAELEIAAPPEQIVTTVGVTQALDLVAREFTRAGDTIFVDDPAWFLMFGSFAALGARVIGIPRLADGPDLARLAQMAALHKPKLYVINSVLHNPSSTSLSAAKAFQVLRLAEEHGFTIVEDDIYCDLHPGSAVQPATRLAALDQLQRVIYLGGFSKSMAANLRVGFIATSPEWAQRLADRKMLATLTSSDIGERVVYKILSEGLYRKHLDRIRARLDAIRGKTVRQMERVGLTVDTAPPAGMFVWADAGARHQPAGRTGDGRRPAAGARQPVFAQPAAVDPDAAECGRNARSRHLAIPRARNGRRAALEIDFMTPIIATIRSTTVSQEENKWPSPKKKPLAFKLK